MPACNTGRDQFEGDVIILLVAESPIDKWTDGNVPLPSALNMNANILKKQIACDFELVSEQGKRFKCHKVFLAVNSPVLARMLETECEEVKHNAYK
ncbi:Speckle-type POZ protein [Orchesella cincta]|uniref:Speckle-type POZ protein n=1 Tax=Orchesella cincta TaxID=48709 RepID=A0A1D2M6H0_ORCCI|nr:Speckle-type POZ protein [Orchesella cincta]